MHFYNQRALIVWDRASALGLKRLSAIEGLNHPAQHRESHRPDTDSRRLTDVPQPSTPARYPGRRNGLRDEGLRIDGLPFGAQAAKREGSLLAYVYARRWLWGSAGTVSSWRIARRAESNLRIIERTSPGGTRVRRAPNLGVVNNASDDRPTEGHQIKEQRDLATVENRRRIYEPVRSCNSRQRPLESS
jgi:hypothetical protein